jgi:hypothetical protein
MASAKSKHRLPAILIMTGAKEIGAANQRQAK